MIQKESLYEAAQTAFSEHHPRFPWPKRHDLADQSPQFQKAFGQFARKVNEYADTVVLSTTDAIKHQAAHYKGKYNRALEDVERAQKSSTTAWIFSMIVVVACAIILKINL